MLKFSEAVRAGIVDTVQGFERYNPGHREYCVLGTAALGWKRSDPQGLGRDVLSYLDTPDVMKCLNAPVRHPTRGGWWDIWSAAIDLNDELKWSREEIAVWAEKQGY